MTVEFDDVAAIRAGIEFMALHRLYCVDPRWRPSDTPRAPLLLSPPRRKKRGKYNMQVDPRDRKWAWTPERRLRYAEIAREVGARPEVKLKRAAAMKAHWVRRRQRVTVGGVVRDIIPAWVVREGLVGDFIDTMLESGEADAAAHCRKLLKMERKS